MFIGHFGVGFGAKKYAPVISLGYLFIAAQFIDLLWPILLLLNIEQVVISPGITKMTPLDFTYYPFSHSLLMVAGWGILLGLITWLFLKKFKYSVVIFLCVISHWFLDLLVHRPDLPLSPAEESIKIGFGLWNHPVFSMILEGLIFLTGVFFYYKVTKPVNKTGKYLLIFLVSFLALIQMANMLAPPPPGVMEVAWAGQLQWLFVIIAFIVDRNRTSNVIQSDHKT